MGLTDWKRGSGDARAVSKIGGVKGWDGERELGMQGGWGRGFRLVVLWWGRKGARQALMGQMAEKLWAKRGR